MSILATVLTYLLSLVVVTCVSFAVGIVLAGPHAGLLPIWLEAAVIGLGFLAILILPVFPARKVCRHFAKKKHVDST